MAGQDFEKNFRKDASGYWVKVHENRLNAFLNQLDGEDTLKPQQVGAAKRFDELLRYARNQIHRP